MINDDQVEMSKSEMEMVREILPENLKEPGTILLVESELNKMFKVQTCQRRWHVEHTNSHSISYVEQRQAKLGWVRFMLIMEFLNSIE